MRKINKTVIISGTGDQHGGDYIFDRYWHGLTRNEFVDSPDCSGVSHDKPSRVYCDSTEYLFFWNGPKETGVIHNFLPFMKCGVTYPAADQVNPVLLATAVFTWAEGEPSNPLTEQSCVLLMARQKDGMWAAVKTDTCLPVNQSQTPMTGWLAVLQESLLNQFVLWAISSAFLTMASNISS